MVSKAYVFHAICHPDMCEDQLPKQTTVSRVVYDAWYMYQAARLPNISEPLCCPCCGFFPDVVIDARSKTAITLGRDELKVLLSQ